MYLNSEKIVLMKMLDWSIIVAVTLPTIVHFWFVMYAYTQIGTQRTLAFLIMIAFFSLLIVAGIAIIYWRATVLYKLTRARIYNSIMEEDHDGIITYDSIASMTGYPVSKVVKDLMWFRNRRVLVNMTLGRTALRVDLRADSNEFIKVVCPECGAHVDIRKGGGGKCNHCGTFMRVKED